MARYGNMGRLVGAAAAMLFALCVALGVGGKAEAAGTTYYVSASAGDDANAGTSEQAPWKTLAKVSSVPFQPGDVILLKGGDVWTGESLNVRGSGTASEPIVLSSYGTGRPKISHYGTALLLENVSGWTVRGLELEVRSNATLTGGGGIAAALMVAFSGGGPYSDITIQDNLIYGEGIDRSTEGIYVTALHPGNLNEEVARNLTIADNTIRDLGWRAVYTGGWDTDGGKGMTSTALFHNVRILRNTVSNIGNQGMILSNANHSAIKWNVVHHAGQYAGSGVTWGPGGIWPIYGSHIEIKFNEVYAMSDSGIGYDAAGINIDCSSEFVVVRYNYSHDNKGPGITTMANIHSLIANNKVGGNYGLTTIGSGQIALSDATNEPQRLTGVKQLRIEDNLISVDRPGTAAITSRRFYTTGDAWAGNGITGNNILLQPNTPGTQVYDFGEGGTIDQANGNRIYSAGGSEFRAAKSGTTYASLADWRSGTGYDANSATAVLDPSPPGNVAGLSGAPNAAPYGIALSWTAATDAGSGIDHYNIYRSTNPSFTPSYATMVGEAKGTSFVDAEELEPATTYYYKVEAEDRNGRTSPAPAAVSVTSGAAPPAPLRVFQASRDFSAFDQGPVWWYQYGQNGSYTNIPAYYPAWHAWRLGQTSLMTGGARQHPDLQDSVRTWVAPYSGNVTISAAGPIAMEQTGPTADGVRVKVLRGTSQLWPGNGWQTVTTDAPVSFPNLSVSVTKGETIRFLVNRGQTHEYDTTLWDPIVAYTSIVPPSPPPATPGVRIPSPLTVEEMRDDFEDGDAAGWTAAYGSWTVVSGAGRAYRQTDPNGGMVYAGQSGWSDYTVEASVTPTAFSASGGSVSLGVLYRDAANRYTLQFNSNGTIEIKKFANGTSVSLGSKAYPVTAGTRYAVRADVYRDGGSGGQSIRMYVNGLLELTVYDTASILTEGRVALDAWRAQADFDDIAVHRAANVWVEAQDWWYDSFEDPGATASSWSVGGGSWSPVFDKTRSYKQTGYGAASAAAGDPDWRDYGVQVRVKLADAAAGGTVRLAFRRADANHSYYVYLNNDQTVGIGKNDGGVRTILASRSYPIAVGTEYELKAFAVGGQIDLYLNGKKLLSASDTTFVTGGIALETSGATAYFDDVVVQRLPVAPSYTADFENGGTAGWNAVSGSWQIAQGATREYRQTGTAFALSALAGGTWNDFALKARVKIDSASGAGGGFAHLNFRYRDADNYYFVYLNDNNAIEIKKKVAGVQTSLAYKPYLVSLGREYRVQVVVSGSHIDLYINGVKELSATDSSFASGGIALETWQAAASFDDVAVTAL
ncbi:right-handed parallel beta-helix repeat-containing protein [Paenibacillus flagellatus]|uniref:Fibronectin type-III domain-containing protein n=1 Tax=Paenibacillus flagellatus TaxID=2211139 RepID=A0A2V5L1K0_9BACL|nr:right-handed parallel beta-helix repeat-containing protein [Paenibacillus flagellatus]PYI56616.1 hypothetical protein DLM86_06515 [Paenibacillus flagellatus]